MQRLWGFPQLGVKPPRLFLGAMSRIDPQPTLRTQRKPAPKQKAPEVIITISFLGGLRRSPQLGLGTATFAGLRSGGRGPGFASPRTAIPASRRRRMEKST